MRYALIGCGRVSPNHIAAAKANGLEIAAVCDIDPEKMGAGIPPEAARYTDYREMLAREKPELVAVCTYSGAHAEIALDAIGAGCHVIIEKPVALSMASIAAAGPCSR